MTQSIEQTSLIEQIRVLGPFAHLPVEHLESLLESARVEIVMPGDCLIKQGESDRDYLLLLAGELEVTRKLSGADGEQELYVGRVHAGEGVGEMSLLSSLPRSASVRATQPSRVMRIDGDKMDDVLAWSEAIAGHLGATAEDRHKMNLLRQAKAFSKLPLHNFQAAIKRMQSVQVNNGENVVQQGESGDSYFLIDEGQAEVWRTDPLTEETSCVSTLGPGDVFGEEALILDGFRNATVKMISAGTLLKLTKADFDELIKGELLSEISAQEAHERVKAGQANWIDCRYEMEYENSHISDAQLIPLDQIRELSVSLDKSKTYIIYCRNGRRSRCATFLLRERGFNVFSMKGGVQDWPFELAG